MSLTCIPPAASWVIAKGGRAVCETFDRRHAQHALAQGFEVHAIGSWLANVGSAPASTALSA